MKFTLPDGSDFELNDVARGLIDVDQGVSLLAAAKRMYEAGDGRNADANVVMVAARALELQEGR